MIRPAVMVHGKRRAVVLWLASLFGVILGACSLGNIRPAECSDDVCRNEFGIGSVCNAGYCSAPQTCDTGFDCRAAVGGGACIEGTCRPRFTLHPACQAELLEPENLLDKDLVNDGAPIIVGSMFRLYDESDPYRAAAARLVVREIKAQSGIGGERNIAMVTCDLGGPKDAPLVGDVRTERIRSLIDFFSVTLGAPFIVGPTTSSDSLTAINHIVAKKYPTALISPSATSPALSSVDDRLEEDQPGLFWRTAPSDAYQGAQLATEIVGNYPIPNCGAGVIGGGLAPVNKVAIIHIQDAYGSGLANVFFNEFVKDGRLAEFVPFTEGDDLKTIADTAANYQPDAFLIVAIDSSDTLELMRQFSGYILESGKEHRMVYLTDGSKSDLLLAVDQDDDEQLHEVIFHRTVGTAPASPDPTGSLYKAFETSIDKEFSVKASDHSFIGHTYDAAYVASAGLVYALRQEPNILTGVTVARGMSALSDPAVVKDQQIGIGFGSWPELKAAMQVSSPVVNIRGVTGDLDFDKNGETTATLEVWQPCNTNVCTVGSPCFAQVGAI